MSKKKVNPRRRPVSRVEEIAETRDNAIMLVQAINLTVLADKFGFEREEMERYWQGVAYLSESVKDGKVAVKELVKVLRDEYDIELTAR